MLLIMVKLAMSFFTRFASVIFFCLISILFQQSHCLCSVCDAFQVNLLSLKLQESEGYTAGGLFVITREFSMTVRNTQMKYSIINILLVYVYI